MVSKVAIVELTEGTETSKYLEEEKSTEIPLVAASERGIAQTIMLAWWGCRTFIWTLMIRGSVWESTPKRVKVSYLKV